MNKDKDRRLTIRLDPQNSREKSIISFLDTLDKRKHKSVNGFVIDALEHYISFLSGGNDRFSVRKSVYRLPLSRHRRTNGILS